LEAIQCPLTEEEEEEDQGDLAYSAQLVYQALEYWPTRTDDIENLYRNTRMTEDIESRYEQVTDVIVTDELVERGVVGELYHSVQQVLNNQGGGDSVAEAITTFQQLCMELSSLPRQDLYTIPGWFAGEPVVELTDWDFETHE
jgi:hypothetical protein